MRRTTVLTRWLLTSAFAAALLPAATATWAQESSAPAVPEKLSLKEAITLAVQHNARHRQSYVSVQDAVSRRRSAGELRRSTVDTNINQTIADNRSGQLDAMASSRYDVAFPGGSSLALTGSLPWVAGGSQDGELGVAMTMPLLRGHGRTSDTRTALDRADLSLRSQELSHFLNQQSLVQQVVAAYFNAVRATELVPVQQRAVEFAQQSTSDAQKRLDAGLITEIDLTRAQLNLSRVKVALSNQVESQHNALDNLVLLLGLPVGSFPTLTEPVTYNPTPIDLDAAIREALAHRPELELLRIQRTESQIDMQVAKDKKRPRADLIANITNAGFSILTGGGLSKVLTSLLGLRLSVPVSKTTLQENQAQSERQLDLIDYLEENQRQQIVDDVRGLARAAETAKANLDLLTANLEVAQRSLHIAQRRIEEGLADNRDLLDAEQSITSTESSVLEAKVAYYQTMVDLRRALGQDLLKEFEVPPLKLPEHPVFQTARTAGKSGVREAKGIQAVSVEP